MASCGSFKLRMEVCFFSLGFVLTGIDKTYKYTFQRCTGHILHVDTDKASMYDPEKAIINYYFEIFIFTNGDKWSQTTRVDRPLQSTLIQVNKLPSRK